MNNMFLDVDFKISKDRKAEDGGEYTTFYYYILPSSPAAAIEQYNADQVAAGYTVIQDEDTGLFIYRNYRMVPTGCRVKRSQKGKWYADTTKLREMAELAKMYPSLDLGKHVAAMYIGNSARTALPVATPEPQDGGDIDPFK